MRLGRTVRFGIASTFGFSGNDVYLLKSLRHSQWLLRTFFSRRPKVPVQRLDVPAPTPVVEEDAALCQRLIEAYRRARPASDDRLRVSPMWQANLDTVQSKLRTLLEAGEAAPLAELMSRFLRSPVVKGIDTGDLYTGRNWKAHSLKALDDLVSLAEQLGLVRTESGQGASGTAFSEGLESLAQRIEKALGIGIGFPDVGSPYGLRIGDRLLPTSSPEYLYVAWRIRQVIAAEGGPGPIRILEIGAGYGGTANFLMRLLHETPARYTIIDLPEMNALQGYFLAKALGSAAVALFGEDDAQARMRILPPQALDGHGRVDVVINENSFPEIPLEAARAYLAWIEKMLDGFFYSYNHETIVPGGEFAVITVPELMSEFEGLRRSSRNLSWVRPGYVEEIYRPA